MKPTNEWAQLNKVVVGVAEQAKIPELELSMRTINYADVSDTSEISVGNYPQQVIEEASER